MADPGGARETRFEAGADEHTLVLLQVLSPKQLRAQAQAPRQRAESLYEQAVSLWVQALDRERRERTS